MREQILDAAAASLAEEGWAATTVAGVAARAGLSRQRLYRELPGKPALAEALVAREVGRLLVQMEEALAGAVGAEAAVVAAAGRVLERAADDVLLRAALGAPGAEDLLPLLTVRGQPLLDAGRTLLVDHLLTGWPGTDAHDARLVADAAVRLTHSVLLTGTADARRSAEHVGRVLRPFLSEVLHT